MKKDTYTIKCPKCDSEITIKYNTPTDKKEKYDFLCQEFIRIHNCKEDETN
jgi:hypothetical protein